MEASMERNTKSRHDSHPGATASLFTDDLILEILSRLPARSLHRFKCVSVSWRHLIADPANSKKLPQALAGFLYTFVLLGMDMEGKVWETIHVPYGSRFGTIGSSQGCLHYAIPSVDDNNGNLFSEIELWCLKDCDTKELVLKHTVSIKKLMSMTGKKYLVVEFHPDCDTIFLVSSGGDTLAAYDMRHQKVGYILNLEKSNTQQFLPYVPLFSESLADADADGQ